MEIMQIYAKVLSAGMRQLEAWMERITCLKFAFPFLVRYIMAGWMRPSPG